MGEPKGAAATVVWGSWRAWNSICLSVTPSVHRGQSWKTAAYTTVTRKAPYASPVVNMRRLTRDDPTTTGVDVAQAPSRFFGTCCFRYGFTTAASDDTFFILLPTWPAITVTQLPRNAYIYPTGLPSGKLLRRRGAIRQRWNPASRHTQFVILKRRTFCWLRSVGQDCAPCCRHRVPSCC